VKLTLLIPITIYRQKGIPINTSRAYSPVEHGCSATHLFR
jgi:hypothetical protein